MNREEVVQAALTVERWCETQSAIRCDCPFFDNNEPTKCNLAPILPKTWSLAEHLRTRGLKDGSV